MSGRTVWLIARKELQGLYTEKTIILAIALQLFIALFSSFLVVGLTSMYDPGAVSRYAGDSYGIGYAGENSSLIDYLKKDGNFRVYQMDLSDAVAALRERKLAGVIYMPSTPPEGSDPVIVTLYLIQNDL
jgi:ABC-2 type transport system permease protein